MQPNTLEGSNSRAEAAPGWKNQLDSLIGALGATAKQRDAQGGTPLHERRLVRESGLLALTVEAELGGHGESFGTLLSVVQRMAAVDPALAHVFAFHHLMLASLRLFGSEAQWRASLAATARERLFWGNALNPKDPGARLRRVGGHYQIDGVKSFCSGARDSDRLLVSAFDEEEKLVVAAIPTRRQGIDTPADWDAFGQRQTDSGSVIFSEVRVDEAEILRTPGPLGNPRAALRPCLAQAILTHLYLGIAEGAWSEAQTRHRQRPNQRTEDPYVQLRAGELGLALEGARLFAERARRELDRALAREDVDAEARGVVALHVARAKVSATHAGLAVTQGLFDLLGPRATGRSDALDRYWRNLRVHTLHDPVDHKLKELGAYELAGRFPSPSFYS